MSSHRRHRSAHVRHQRHLVLSCSRLIAQKRKTALNHCCHVTVSSHRRHRSAHLCHQRQAGLGSPCQSPAQRQCPLRYRHTLLRRSRQQQTNQLQATTGHHMSNVPLTAAVRRLAATHRRQGAHTVPQHVLRMHPRPYRRHQYRHHTASTQDLTGLHIRRHISTVAQRHNQVTRCRHDSNPSF